MKLPSRIRVASTTFVSDRIAGIPQFLCVALSLWFVAAFLYVALNSITFPFHLEWIEGHSIDVVQRITRGLPVYAEPSLEYVAFIYTPMYYYVSAIVSLFTGVDFFAGRLVSLCAALGTGGLIYQWIRKDGGSWKSALIGAGLFYATYRYSGRWFDLARVDSLGLFLSMAAAYVFTFSHGRKSIFATAALVAAAFLTKQSGFVSVAPLLLAGIVRNVNHGLSTATAAGVLTLAFISYLEESSAGWFSFYAFALPAGHTVDEPVILQFWTQDVVGKVGVLFAMSLALVATHFRSDRKKAIYYGMLLAGFVLAAYSSRLHRFGYINNLMPLHAILALFAGLALGAVERRGRPGLRVLASLLVVAQLYSMLYNPTPLIPSQKALDAGNKFMQELAKINGDVFMPDIQFVSTRTGKKSFAFGMPAFDIFRATLGKTTIETKTKLNKAYADAIRQKKFAAVMPGRLIFFDIPGLRENYRISQRLEYPEGVALDSINLRKMDVYIPIGPEPKP